MPSNTINVNVRRALRDLQRAMDGAHEFNALLRQIRAILPENNNNVPDTTEEVVAYATATITVEENQQKLGCSVCLEDFELGENVNVLPCKVSELFHYLSSRLSLCLIQITNRLPFFFYSSTNIIRIASEIG